MTSFVEGLVGGFWQRGKWECVALGLSLASCGASIAKQFEARQSACGSGSTDETVECWRANPVEGESTSGCEVYVDDGPKNGWHPWHPLKAEATGAMMLGGGEPKIGDRYGEGTIGAISLGCLIEQKYLEAQASKQKRQAVEQQRRTEKEALEKTKALEAAANAMRAEQVRIDAMGECGSTWDLTKCDVITDQYYRYECRQICSKRIENEIDDATEGARKACVERYVKSKGKSKTSCGPEIPGKVIEDRVLEEKRSYCSGWCLAYGREELHPSKNTSITLRSTPESGPNPGPVAVCARQCAEQTDSCRGECRGNLQCEAACADQGTRCVGWCNE